uniref:Uncharacterized protein n=1 Tax=Tetranychus urticae TaxID=32264 RepID=T1JYD0_TETUR
MCSFINQCKVNGLSMEKLIVNSLIFIVILRVSSASASSTSTDSSTTALSSSTTVKTETELISSESKDSEDKNDLLKGLKDFGPDDLAKLIKAKKEKELDEFKSKVTNIRGNREALDSYQQKGVPIVQQHEDDYQSQTDQSEEDDFDGGNDSSSSGVKRPKFGNLGSFIPNPGSVMTMMVKPIDRPEQMQQLWPPMVSNRKVPIMPPMAPMAPIQPMQPPISLFPPNPFSFIGQHFANKPRHSHKKKQMNPLSLLLMGLTGTKRKRPRPRPVYHNYPAYQQQPISPILPEFESNEPDYMYPVTQNYNTKGSKGASGKKGRRRPKNPSYNHLPPPPSSIKGKSKGKTSFKGKWNWPMQDDYKDLQQGFNE